ncbi:hypothetical protein K503DRAFT_679125 [Rhizopogon vinicolor AM-OR11-026]|uniref:T6SS Phospholipase effector Tle1-like catalytic domain-containing protein n=1 Tax=Rhizopogon vinicolor AM-OR11-026 TaxID=1314800 RepID=A0A1B7NHU1_9AGAM|nr:hypothetical protein K503DRAFT_679125 [Rhizopogon vinicolor AM-OR11-026]
MSDIGGSELSREPKILIATFDGTAGSYNTANSNVVKFVSLLKKDTDCQLSYYQQGYSSLLVIQAGVGTYFSPGVVSPMFISLAKILDEAFAWYLDEHVMEGYRFLMDNYRSGDKICLFGFSRGAYTARALAGMLYKVGLLPKSNLQQVRFAYKAYKQTGKVANEFAAGFKQTFSRDVKVEFVGVWDTVQSTGVLMSRNLPFTDSNTLIKTFRHALALDEHRVRFQPELYHRSRSDTADPEYAEMSKFRKAVGELENKASGKISSLRNKFQKKFKKKSKCEEVEVVVERTEETIVNGEANVETLVCVDIEPEPSTDVLEVWFPGCHSDIGGGNVANCVEVSLAQNTLRWMVEQVIQSQCGILFDEEALERSPTIPSQPNPEICDALAPLFDELQLQKAWWLLEIMLLPYAWQDACGKWHTKWSFHLGKGRVIPYQHPNFHTSVQERMNYAPLHYTPRAIYQYGQEVFV